MGYNKISCTNCVYHSYNRNFIPCRHCTVNPKSYEELYITLPRFYFEPRFKKYGDELIEQVPSYNVFFDDNYN